MKRFIDNLVKIVTISCLIVITYSAGVWSYKNLKCDKDHQNVKNYSSVIIPTKNYLQTEFSDEYETIMAAAHRNGCFGDNSLVLFAVRKAENGGPGIEFGIECQRGTNLNMQAGWAAATIMKNRSRWYAINARGNFIVFLGKRYCPLNSEVWIKNVTYWYEIFKEKQE